MTKKRIKKHAYNCMIKTSIQTRIQMYEKNRHTNAYKCMIKTGIQMYEKNRHTNTHTNVLKKQAYKCITKTRRQKRIQVYEKKQAYKCMTKTRIQTRIQMYDKNTQTKTHTSVWKKTGIQLYVKNILIYWSGGQPITAPMEHGGTVPFSRAPQPWQGGELPPGCHRLLDK